MNGQTRTLLTKTYYDLKLLETFLYQDNVKENRFIRRITSYNAFTLLGSIVFRRRKTIEASLNRIKIYIHCVITMVMSLFSVHITKNK